MIFHDPDDAVGTQIRLPVAPIIDRRTHSVTPTECDDQQSEWCGADGGSQEHRSARSMTHHTVRSVYRHGPKMEWCQSLRGLTARVHCTHAASGHHVRPMPGQDRPGGRSWRPHRAWTGRLEQNQLVRMNVPVTLRLILSQEAAETTGTAIQYRRPCTRIQGDS